MPRPPLDKQMLDYIIDDAVDDFQDTIDGVKELARVFQDENLEHIVRQLNEYKTYVGNLKKKMPEEPAGYAIYYYTGVDYYPASSTFEEAQDAYTSKENAERIAHTLSIRNRGVEFGVYPVNENYEIIGKPVQKYGVSSRFPR